MKPASHSLALLRNANPVSVEPAVVRSAQARATFERIIAEPRVSNRDARRMRRSTARFAGAFGARTRLAVSGAGITAVAAALIVGVLSGSAAAPAFAGWTARPTVGLQAATRRCGLTSPALVEARGPYTAAVFASPSGGSACVVGPSLSFVGSVGGVQAADNRFKPNQIGVTDLSGSDKHGHGFILLTGRAGSAVRTIVIHRRNQAGVVASIKDGWYLAWWPASTPATNATVTTTSGRYNLALPASATTASPCSGFMHSHPSGACMSIGPGSNGPGSAGVPGPPLVAGPLAKPFGHTLLLQVDNASRVLVCFHPPADETAALQANGPTGPCARAVLLTRLPARYPVQKNLLEVFPRAVWKINLPARSRHDGRLVFLVVADGRSNFPPARSELNMSW